MRNWRNPGNNWAQIESANQLMQDVRDQLQLDGCTQTDLAAYLGCSQSHLSKVLTGHAGASPEFLARMTKAVGLGVQPS